MADRQIKEFFDKASFSAEKFVAAVRNRLEGKSLPLWCEAESARNLDTVLFTFNDSLLRRITNNPSDWKKDFNAAMTYGFMDYSSGGVNGILRLRDEDSAMKKQVRNHIHHLTDEERKTYHLHGDLDGVKIVCHRPNGLRTIGIRSSDTNRVLFVDRMTYKP